MTISVQTYATMYLYINCLKGISKAKNVLKFLFIGSGQARNMKFYMVVTFKIQILKKYTGDFLKSNMIVKL